MNFPYPLNYRAKTHRMPTAKKAAFKAEDQQLAAIARALAHPARIAILRQLMQRQTCICGELVSALPLSQSTVSQHLQVLLEVGLICATVDGPRSCYCLNVHAIRHAGALVARFLEGLEKAPCC